MRWFALLLYCISLPSTITTPSAYSRLHENIKNIFEFTRSSEYQMKRSRILNCDLYCCRVPAVKANTTGMPTLKAFPSSPDKLRRAYPAEEETSFHEALESMG